MQLGDVAFIALLFGGLLGIGLHPETRLLTGIAAFGLFAVNLWTDIGGPFSFRVFFGTAALLAGALLWEVLRVGRGILLWGRHHADALLSRAEPRDRHPPHMGRSEGPDPTDGNRIETLLRWQPQQIELRIRPEVPQDADDHHYAIDWRVLDRDDN